MRLVDVTVISCLYGDTHDQFVPAWSEGIQGLDPFPNGISIVACEHPAKVVLGGFWAGPNEWKHPQAYYLQQAFERVETEWIWIHDIDDVAKPSALRGIQQIDADVWQLGYERSDGEIYIPPQLDCVEIIQADRNPFVAGSCIRTSTLRSVGGFPDVALQDWALWRRLALAGAIFQSSDRIHFKYTRHPDARGERELKLERRAADLREMLDAEELVAYSI